MSASKPITIALTALTICTFVLGGCMGGAPAKKRRISPNTSSASGTPTGDENDDSANGAARRFPPIPGQNPDPTIPPTTAAPPALGPLTPAGSARELVPGFTRGTDAAYDFVNDVFLFVAMGGDKITGRFTNGLGQPIGESFRVDAGCLYCHFPRVAYGDGNFLVTWHETVDERYTQVLSRLVSYAARGPVSAPLVLPSLGSYHEVGAALAYSRTSREYLVAWQSTVPAGTRTQRISSTGQLVGGVVPLWESYGRNPSVAWNSIRNEFGVSFAGTEDGQAFSAFARVSSSGSMLRRNIFFRSPAIYSTEVAYNTGTANYVMVWYNGETHRAEISADGDVIATSPIGIRVGHIDGLGLSYSPVSRTFLIVGHGDSYEVVGAELDAQGMPINRNPTLEQLLLANAGARLGSFYPRPAASSRTATWQVSYAFEFASMRNQLVGK